MIDSATRQLLGALHQGGDYAYWWSLEARQSFWWPVDHPTPLPGGQRNIYVGVHPTSIIPPTNTQGEPREPRDVRAQLPYIATINCLFGEFDLKDFPDDTALGARIRDLDPAPSVVVHSGGGRHCYWLLDRSWELHTDAARERARKLQAAWVRFVGSDMQSKDLARVLRVPGTYNHKYDPPRKVEIISANFERRYAIDELAALCQHLIESDRSQQTPAANGVSPSAYADAALAREMLNVRRAPDGQKHDTLRNAAIKLGTLIGAGALNQEEAETALFDAIETRASDPAGARKTIRDGVAWGMSRPREIPERPAPAQTQTSAPQAEQPRTWGPISAFHTLDLPAFPADVLPSWLREYVTALAIERQVPIDLPGMLSLAILSTACARRVVVCPKSGWCEPVNMFVMTALPPGTGKSHVFSSMMRPVELYERDQIAGARTMIAKREAQRDVLEAQLASAKREAASSKSQSGTLSAFNRVDELSEELRTLDVPAEPRMVVDDISTERLGTMLFEQDGRIAALSPEGDIFGIMAGRYTQDSTPNFGVYLKGHAGDTLRVDRKGRPSEYVERPALTLGLTVQPSVLQSFADKKSFRGLGLLARFCYAMPKSIVGYRDTDPPPMPTQVRDTYYANVEHLLRVVPILANSYSGNCGDNGETKINSGNSSNLGVVTQNDSNNSSFLLSLPPDSLRLFSQFSQWLEPLLAEDAELGHMADWASKLRGTILRVAGLLHMADTLIPSGSPHNSHNPQNNQISMQTMARAIAVAQYLIPHARAAFAEIGSDPAIIGARKVLAWIEKRRLREVTKREVYQGVKGTFRKAADLDPVFELLIDHGYVRPRDIEERAGPGRKPSQAYDINPALYERHANTGTIASAFALDPALLIPDPVVFTNGTHYREINMGGPLASAADEEPLFTDEDEIIPAVVETPPAALIELNWEYLRQCFAAADTIGIHRHCAMRGVSFHDVLTQLESEAL